MLKRMEKAAILKEATTVEQAKAFVSRLIELSQQVFVPAGDQVSELPVCNCACAAVSFAVRGRCRR